MEKYKGYIWMVILVLSFTGCSKNVSLVSEEKVKEEINQKINQEINPKINQEINQEINQKTNQEMKPKTNQEAEGISFLEEEIPVIQGKDIEFVREDLERFSSVRYNEGFSIYDGETNMLRKLKLPWCEEIMALDGDYIVYWGYHGDGEAITMVGDIKRGKVKKLIDGKLYSTLNRMDSDEDINLVYQLKDTWLYLCNLSFYTETPELYKINILTGEKVIFPESHGIMDGFYEEKDLGKFCKYYIVDERGMIPQRGMNSFDYSDDYNQYWSQTLKSFAFGEEGLVVYPYHISWEGAKERILTDEYEGQKQILSIAEEGIYTGKYGITGSEFGVELYQWGHRERLSLEFGDKVQFSRFGTIYQYDGELLLNNWYDYGEENGFIISTDKFTLEEITSEELKVFMRKNDINKIFKDRGYQLQVTYVNDSSLMGINDTSYESPPEIGNSRNYKGRWGYYIYYEEGWELFLLDSEEKNIRKIYSGRDYYAPVASGGRVIIKNHSRRDKSKHQESIIESFKKEIKIGMKLGEVKKELRNYDVSVREELENYRSFGPYRGDNGIEKIIGEYSFGDRVLNIIEENEERWMSLYFDEKTEELIHIKIIDSSTGKVDFSEKKYSQEYRREEDNEKYWLVLFYDYEDVGNPKGFFAHFVDLSVPLCEEFVEKLNETQLYILENAYYGKYGLSFKDEKLKGYFSMHYWYKEKTNEEEIAEKEMTEVDLKNLELIRNRYLIN